MIRLSVLTFFLVLTSFAVTMPCLGQKIDTAGQDSKAVPQEEAKSGEQDSKVSEVDSKGADQGSETETSIQATFLDDYTIKVSPNDSTETSFEIAHYDLRFPKAKRKTRIWEFDVCADCNLIATAGRDCTLRLWNAKTGAPGRILLKGGEDGCDHGYIWSVSFSPNGELLAAASYTGQAFVFKTESLGLLMKADKFKELSGQGRRAVRFSDDGKTLNLHCADTPTGKITEHVGKVDLKPWLDQLKKSNAPESATAQETSPKPSLKQARDLEKEGKIEEAIKILKQLLAKKRSSGEKLSGVLLFLARFQQKSGDFKGELETRKELLPLDVETWGAKHAMAISQRRMINEANLQLTLTEDERLELQKADESIQEAEKLESKWMLVKAISLLDESLAVQSRLRSESHHMSARTRNKLASLINLSRKVADAHGEKGSASSLDASQRAEQLYLQNIELASQRPDGEVDREIAESLTGLGFLYHKQAKFEEAEPLFRRAVKVKKSLLRKRGLDIANTLNGLGMALYSQKKYKEAEPFYAEALQIRQVRLSPPSEDIAASLLNLAHNYYQLGDTEKGDPLLEEGCEQLKKALGPLNPLTLKQLSSPEYRRLQERLNKDGKEPLSKP